VGRGDFCAQSTWVELEFAPLAGDKLRTRVQLTHYGFKDDAV
jgi:hypothetical protein